MGEDTDSTAALIVHKQAEFTRQFSRTRSTTFASTVADRFYSDNSLDRQRRIVECTKRRQARAREKALEQEEELSQLQQQYEHKRRLRELQSQRECSRMTRKLQHVAAAFIQYSFRCYRQRKHAKRRRDQAAQLLATALTYRWRRRCRARLQACRHIQRHWREYKAWQRTMLCVRVVQRFVRSVTRRRRQKRCCAAIQIQRCFRGWRWRRHSVAAHVLQRAWRAYRLWTRVLETAARSRHAHMRSQHDACARVLQRAMGRYTVRSRLLRSSGFARFLELRTARSRWAHLPIRPVELWQTHRQILADALVQAKRLQNEETKLRSAMDELTTRAKETRDKVADEQERLRRFHAWAEVRRTKEDEQLREQLREWENCKRFEIRMELERELEVERRAQLRAQQLQLVYHPSSPQVPRTSQDDDARVEVS